MSTNYTIEMKRNAPPWWLVLGLGIAAVIFGILFFVGPVAKLTIIDQFLGIYWMITGVISVIMLTRDKAGWGWVLFNVVLGIVAGILIIEYPLWSTLAVPAVLAMIFGIIGLVIGLIQVDMAFHGDRWEVGILGVLSALLGILLIMQPAISDLVLPWLLGILLVGLGIVAIVAGFFEKRLEEMAAEAVAIAGAEQSELVPQGEATAETAAEEEPGMVSKAVEAETVDEESGDGGGLVAGIAAAAVAGAVLADRDDDSQVDEVEPPDAAEGLDAATMAAIAGVAAASQADEVESAEVVEGVDAPVGVGVAAAERYEAEAPSSALTGNVNPNDPEEMVKFRNPLEYVEGIGPIYAEKLRGIGLVTCHDLLKGGATRKGREDISAKSGISPKLILEWVNHVDMYRIKGIGSEYADLLEDAGVDTVVELAQRNPAHLAVLVNEVNLAKALVRKPPTQSQIENWVDQAKGLPRLITY